MSSLVGMFQAFSAAKAVEYGFSFPIKAELMDISGEPFLQTTTEGPNSLGLLSFETKPVGGTLWKKGPFAARLTVKGERPFLVDFPWPPPR